MPSWDARSWRFELTRGSTTPANAGPGGRGSGNEVLTIYSRVGNQSTKALAYPFIVVSLTDRFEEVIGSKALAPGDYLDSSVDIERLVPAGNSFNAAILIDTPPADATGFKLNVCYRQADGLLRCAVEAFR
jgi:hypothetical protein